MPFIYKQNPLLIALKHLISDKAPDWNFVRSLYPDHNSVYAEWGQGEDNVIIQVLAEVSDEAAAKHFQKFGAIHIPVSESQMAGSVVPPLRLVAPDGKLSELTCENNVWTRYDEAGRSLVKFRKHKLVVQVDASTHKIARNFARLISDSISTE